jgi:hypothetical protein
MNRLEKVLYTAKVHTTPQADAPARRAAPTAASRSGCRGQVAPALAPTRSSS